MSQRLVAEFVGTFALVFVGVGAILHQAGDLVAAALAYGLAVAVMVTAVGHISGGHFNPAVTLGMLATAKIKATDAVAYMASQAAGAIAAAAILRVVMPEPQWRAASLGTPTAANAVGAGNAVIIEAILTFFVVWVIFATAVDPEGAFGKIAGLAIGFTVVLAVLMGGPLTGGAVNPARWLGPAAVGGFWSNWYVWLIGPFAGAVIAASLYDGLILANRGAGGSAEPGEAPHGWGAHGEDADAVVDAEHDHD